MNVKELSEVYSNQFDRAKRLDSGREYFFASKDSDGSLQKLIHYAIGEGNHSDVSYEFVYNALDAIEGCSDIEQIDLSIVATHSDLIDWLADSPDRGMQVEDVVNHDKQDRVEYKFDLFDAMLTAYTQEAYDVLYSVIEYLKGQLGIVNEA